ncbi:MAG: alpha-amylase family glycosyl hydrolase, partial [Bacteroidota bacterium]
MGLTSEPVSVFQINPAAFNWTDQTFVRPAKSKLVVYELLVRDFLEDRSYQSLKDSLDYLENLGVTAIELMPINEFEGNNSWGYNPSFYFAPDKAYGTAEALKTFINEAHNRGIAVILDIALNHSFGQNPMVRMYFNPNAGDYGQPTAENPWFNQTPKHDFNVGYDFNHESTRTRDFCKRVLAYWMNEFHVDGYRFDLSKGFTQNFTLGNIGDWGVYDQSRINILTDYYSHIQANEPGAYVILEHFANNDEESTLSSNGMMLWGNLNHEYLEG